jgi:hypothetical protein
VLDTAKAGAETPALALLFMALLYSKLLAVKELSCSLCVLFWQLDGQDHIADFDPDCDA